jgi:hypothetical protein
LLAALAGVAATSLTAALVRAIALSRSLCGSASASLRALFATAVLFLAVLFTTSVLLCSLIARGIWSRTRRAFISAFGLFTSWAVASLAAGLASLATAFSAALATALAISFTAATVASLATARLLSRIGWPRIGWPRFIGSSTG